MSNSRPLLDAARDAAARYTDGLDARSVMPSAAAIDALRALRTPMPDGPTSAGAVLELLDQLGSPATVATTGGRFFGFVTGGALPVTVAANWLAAAWDQNAGVWILSPIAAELETVAAAWLLDIFDLPRDAAVGFVTGCTMGAFSSFAVARSALLRRAGYDVKRWGLTGAPRIRVVASAETHPTNLAALGYVGFGLDEIERCPVDDQGRVRADAMPELDSRTLVVLQAGNINSGASDPFVEVCAKARAARGKRSQVAGLELADSWSVDGHKWLNLPHDAAIYACRDAEAVNDVFGVEATYLVRDANRQPNAFTPELSRRARGIEFWAALQHLGRSGVEALVEGCCAYARRFAEGLAEAGYEVLNDVVLNQVAFACADEAHTRAALAAVQASGVCWLGPTHWRGRFAMRISVSSWATTAADVERSLAVMHDAFHATAAAHHTGQPA